jgi:hypothetical protein
MSEPTDAVEGQALARAILQALDQGRPPDWAALDRAYREPLLRVAAARLHRLGLHRQFTPDDAVHDFLRRSVYPPRRARMMFAPSARGERPLSSRLLTSLGNHCTDLGRAAGRRREQGGHEDLVASTPARPADPLPAYEEVEGLLCQQMDAIRAACPPRRRPRGAAYREALLLRHRLDLAGGFDGVELRSERDGGAVLLDLPLLERLTAWTEEERATPLVEGGAVLQELWRQARALVEGSPDREVSSDRLARLVPVSRGLWNQWVSRGRRLVQAKLGAESGRVFATWGRPGEGA